MEKDKSKKPSLAIQILSKKRTLLFLSLIFCLSMLLYQRYQTYAALTDKDQVQNDFKVGNVQATVEEEFQAPNAFEPDKEYTKKVTVRNTGEQEIFLRVLSAPVLIKKQADGSNLLLPLQDKDGKEILTIDYNTNDWIDGSDGYFYYKKKLSTDQVTSALFTKVKMNKGIITEEYDGAILSFEIKSEAIGITKYAYRDAWWQGNTPTVNPLLEVDTLLETQTLK